MDDADRLRLLYGPYAHPPFAYGDEARCEVRGSVEIVGLSETPVPWPVGKRGRAKSLVVYAGLAEAVRRESAQAVAHHWGVTTQTVTVWRKALNVGALTEGTRRLKRDHALGPGIEAARAKAVGKARDPERRRKIAEGLRGRTNPAHVVEAMREGRTGKPQSAETRARMSESHKKRRGRTPGP